MKTADIHRLTGEKIGRTAVQAGSTESSARQIHGKWAVITPFVTDEEILWDVWILNNRDRTAGLTSRKLTAILDKLQFRGHVHRLDGEAHFTAPSATWIVDRLKTLGIRRRRKHDPLAADRMRKLHETKRKEA